MNESLGGLRQALVVTFKQTIAAQPSEDSLDDSSAREAPRSPVALFGVRTISSRTLRPLPQSRTQQAPTHRIPHHLNWILASLERIGSSDRHGLLPNPQLCDWAKKLKKFCRSQAGDSELLEEALHFTPQGIVMDVYGSSVTRFTAARETNESGEQRADDFVT
jgi:hypothetical protein